MRTRFLCVITAAVVLAACGDRGARADGASPADSAEQAGTAVSGEPPVVDAPPTPAIDPDSLHRAVREEARLPTGPRATAPSQPAPRTYAQCMAEAAKAPAEERAVLENSCRGLPGKN